MENFWHMIFRHFNIYNDIYATSIQSSCLSVYIFVCIWPVEAYVYKMLFQY